MDFLRSVEEVQGCRAMHSPDGPTRRAAADACCCCSPPATAAACHAAATCDAAAACDAAVACDAAAACHAAASVPAADWLDPAWLACRAVVGNEDVCRVGWLVGGPGGSLDECEGVRCGCGCGCGCG